MRDKVDQETGEIIWDHKKECAKIKETMMIKQCFLSRMPEITDGKFWKATIYSPKDSNKQLNLPIKKDRKANFYGSYSEVQYAYFFVYQGFKKDGSLVKNLSAVPINVASLVDSQGDQGLINFARKEAEANGQRFDKIIKKRVLKKQLVEYHGNLFKITGKKEIRNASQLQFSKEEILLINRIYADDVTLSEEETDDLILNLFDRSKKLAPYLSEKLKLDILASNLERGSLQDKFDLVKSVISIVNGSKNKINTKVFGGSSNAGTLTVTFSNILDSLVFIDQSVTGMFERKFKLD